MENIQPINVDLEDLEYLRGYLSKLTEKYELRPEHPRQGEFQKLCLQGDVFKPIPILKILRDAEPTSSAFKEILAAGLCGWVIDPSDNFVAQTFMAIEAQRHINECIDLTSNGEIGYSDIHSIIGRYVAVGRNFHTDIQHQFDRTDPLEHQMSVIETNEFIAQFNKDLNSVNYCLITLHSMQDIYANRKKCLPPSWNRVRKFASLKCTKSTHGSATVQFQSQLRETSLRRGWLKYKPAFPMLYAANFVKISRSMTLLEMIFSATINSRAVLEHFDEWLGKSAYYYTNYLNSLGETTSSKVGLWLESEVKCVKIRAPKLGSALENEMYNALKKQEKSIIKINK